MAAEQQTETPRLFIGSSSEGLAVAEYLQLALEPYCEATIWSQGVFGLSEGNLQSLIDATEDYDFAILVLTPDDMVIKRGISRAAARDNILFEIGLFIGSLGKERTFLVYCRDDRIDLPSDLSGVTLAAYRKRHDGNMQAAIHPVSVRIREAMKKVRESTKAMKTTQPADVGLTSIHDRGDMHNLDMSSNLLKYVADLTESVGAHRAGIALSLEDQERLAVWSGNALGMLQDLYAARQSDVYSVWYRPSEDNPRALRFFAGRNFREERKRYEFALDEGLAGKVWKTGIFAAQSVLRHHPWWVFREGCDTVSYICVPVGETAGAGGVLAVGSDLGFEVYDYDAEILRIFAAMLALGLRASAC